LYTDAWVGLGQSWVLLPVWEFDYASAPQQIENARRAAARALELDPQSGRAYAVLGYIHMLKMEWRESFENYELAIKHEPGNATTWQWYGDALGNVGKHEPSLVAFKRAIELDPRSRIIGSNLAEGFIQLGNYEAALDRIDQTLAFAPDFIYGWQVKGFIHMLRNEFEQARVAFQTISGLSGGTRDEPKTIDLIEDFARTGKPGQTPDWINDPKHVDPYYASLALVLAGQYEAALDLIERRSKGTIPQSVVFYLHCALFQEKLGDMPRYQELVQRIATFETGTD